MMPIEARLGGIGTALIANCLRSVKRGCWAPHCKAARLDGDKSGPRRMLLISFLFVSILPCGRRDRWAKSLSCGVQSPCRDAKLRRGVVARLADDQELHGAPDQGPDN
jgi:hypothetical protein